MALHGGDLLLESHDLCLLVSAFTLSRILGVLDIGGEAVVLSNGGDALDVFRLDHFLEAHDLQEAVVLGEFLTSEGLSARVAGDPDEGAVVTKMLAALVEREELVTA